MKYLMLKAAELVDGLSEIRSIHFYTNTSGKTMEGYTKDLLVVDFNDNTRKLYKYSITREQFEIIGKSSRFFPVKVSNWIITRNMQRY